jgi:hypothetical protein
MPMDMELIDNLVEFLHLALLRDQVAEIQDVDVEKKPLFGRPLLSLIFHVLPRCKDSE